MVKYTIGHNHYSHNCENTKFTRELNTYGVDENGIGDELLFPIRLNGKPGENQETNLATYLIKYKEFEKTENSRQDTLEALETVKVETELARESDYSLFFCGRF